MSATLWLKTPGKRLTKVQSSRGKPVTKHNAYTSIKNLNLPF